MKGGAMSGAPAKRGGFAWITGTASLAFTISIFFLGPGIFATDGGYSALAAGFFV